MLRNSLGECHDGTTIIVNAGGGGGGGSGAQGSIGPQGPQGTLGPTGVQGPRGSSIQGPMGPTGLQQGLQGISASSNINIGDTYRQYEYRFSTNTTLRNGTSGSYFRFGGTLIKFINQMIINVRDACGNNISSDLIANSFGYIKIFSIDEPLNYYVFEVTNASLQSRTYFGITTRWVLYDVIFHDYMTPNGSTNISLPFDTRCMIQLHYRSYPTIGLAMRFESNTNIIPNSRNGTYDRGKIQLNSSTLNTVSRLSIGRKDIYNDSVQAFVGPDLSGGYLCISSRYKQRRPLYLKTSNWLFPGSGTLAYTFDVSAIYSTGAGMNTIDFEDGELLDVEPHYNF